MCSCIQLKKFYQRKLQEKFHGLGQVRSFMVWASEKKVSWFGQVKQCETHPQHLLSLLFPQLFLESSLYVI